MFRAYAIRKFSHNWYQKFSKEVTHNDGVVTFLLMLVCWMEENLSWLHQIWKYYAQKNALFLPFVHFNRTGNGNSNPHNMERKTKARQCMAKFKYREKIFSFQTRTLCWKCFNILSRGVAFPMKEEKFNYLQCIYLPVAFFVTGNVVCVLFFI